MLQALYDAMVENLHKLKAPEEKINSYQKRWYEALNGSFGHYPCPACFLRGIDNSALKAQPAKASTHYVKCSICNSVYSYMEEDF